VLPLVGSLPGWASGLRPHPLETAGGLLVGRDSAVDIGRGFARRRTCLRRRCSFRKVIATNADTLPRGVDVWRRLVIVRITARAARRTRKASLSLKPNLDHCPDCGLALQPDRGLEPLLVAAAANREAAKGGQSATPAPPEAPDSRPSPAAAPRSPRTEHFSDPAPAGAPRPQPQPRPRAGRRGDPPPAAENRRRLPSRNRPPCASEPSLDRRCRRRRRRWRWPAGSRGPSFRAARPRPRSPFRLCGSDALGGRLGFDLVQGFLNPRRRHGARGDPLRCDRRRDRRCDVSGNPTRNRHHGRRFVGPRTRRSRPGRAKPANRRPPADGRRTGQDPGPIPRRASGFARRSPATGVVVVGQPGQPHQPPQSGRRAPRVHWCRCELVGARRRAGFRSRSFARDEGPTSPTLFTSRALGSERITAPRRAASRRCAGRERRRALFDCLICVVALSAVW